jgi:hypothetical protein
VCSLITDADVDPMLTSLCQSVAVRIQSNKRSTQLIVVNRNIMKSKTVTNACS